MILYETPILRLRFFRRLFDAFAAPNGRAQKHHHLRQRAMTCAARRAGLFRRDDAPMFSSAPPPPLFASPRPRTMPARPLFLPSTPCRALIIDEKDEADKSRPSSGYGCAPALISLLSFSIFITAHLPSAFPGNNASSFAINRGRDSHHPPLS